MRIFRRFFKACWSMVLRLAGEPTPRGGRRRSLDPSAVQDGMDSVNGMGRIRINGRPPIYLVHRDQQKRRRLDLDEHEKHEEFVLKDDEEDELLKLAIRLELERRWELEGSDNHDKWTKN